MCLSCGCFEPANDHQDSRNITLLDLRCAAEAVGISVTEAAANLGQTLALCVATKRSATPPSDTAMCVVKATAEKRYTLGLAYPAMRPDVNRAADGYIDFASHEVLEQTAWNYMAKHRDINLFHKGGTSGHATVVESYLYRGPDWHQTSPVDGKEYVIKAGDWMLGTVWDDHGWQLVKAGLVNGWSPEGGAARAVPTPDRIAQLRRS